MTDELAGNTSLLEAMAKAQAVMGHAHFDAENTHFRSKYATLASVIDAVRPALSKHSISFTQHIHERDGAIGVETILHHPGGGELSSGIVWVPISKQDAHGLGSALTYGKRYSLALVTGIASEEDDDGNAAVSGQANPRQKSRKPPPPKPNPDQHVAYDPDIVPGGKYKGTPWSEMSFEALVWLRDQAKPGPLKQGGLAELTRRESAPPLEPVAVDPDDDLPF